MMTLLCPSMMRAQQATQTVRGQVCDLASGEPMVGVTITVENGITMGTVSDIDGNFEIKNVPVGRHSVRATYIGYEPVLLKEQLVTSGKELVLNLRMQENVSELGVGYRLKRIGTPDLCQLSHWNMANFSALWM